MTFPYNVLTKLLVLCIVISSAELCFNVITFPDFGEIATDIAVALSPRHGDLVFVFSSLLFPLSSLNSDINHLIQYFSAIRLVSCDKESDSFTPNVTSCDCTQPSSVCHFLCDDGGLLLFHFFLSTHSNPSVGVAKDSFLLHFELPQPRPACLDLMFLGNHIGALHQSTPEPRVYLCGERFQAARYVAEGVQRTTCESSPLPPTVVACGSSSLPLSSFRCGGRPCFSRNDSAYLVETEPLVDQQTVLMLTSPDVHLSPDGGDSGSWRLRIDVTIQRPGRINMALSEADVFRLYSADGFEYWAYLRANISISTSPLAVCTPRSSPCASYLPVIRWRTLHRFASAFARGMRRCLRRPRCFLPSLR